jgi:hypothetical protein
MNYEWRINIDFLENIPSNTVRHFSAMAANKSLKQKTRRLYKIRNFVLTIVLWQTKALQQSDLFLSL